jgi:hypothetical protein
VPVPDGLKSTFELAVLFDKPWHFVKDDDARRLIGYGHRRGSQSLVPVGAQHAFDKIGARQCGLGKRGDEVGAFGSWITAAGSVEHDVRHA